MVTRILVLLLLVGGIRLAAESYEDMLDGADLSDPDVHYELGIWCEKKRMRTTAGRHFKKALQLNPDHELTRMHLGFFMVGDPPKWVHKSKIPGMNTPANGGNGNGNGGNDDGPGARAGPGPKASEINWNVRVWPNPDKENRHTGFLDRFVGQLGSEATLWDANATLEQDQYLHISAQRIAEALSRGDRILYGAAMFCADLNRKDRREGTTKHQKYIKRLLPFLMKASENERDPDALYAFCSVVAMVCDKRTIPRLIELLGSGNKDVQMGARDAIAHITLMPRKEVTLESADAWWGKYHAISEQDIYSASLSSKDPKIQFAACKRLYQYQDKRIVPVLARLIGGDDGNLALSAVQLLKRISGTDWSIGHKTPDDKRKEIAKGIAKWWEENKTGYIFVEFRVKDTSRPNEFKENVVQKMIDQLDDLDIHTRDKAYAGLSGMGKKIVPDLVANLGSGSKLKLQKARDLLRTITGQNFNYDPYSDDDAAKTEALSKWRAWLDAELLKEEEAELEKAREKAKAKGE